VREAGRRLERGMRRLMSPLRNRFQRRVRTAVDSSTVAEAVRSITRQLESLEAAGLEESRRVPAEMLAVSKALTDLDLRLTDLDQRLPEKPITRISDLQTFRGYELEDLALFDQFLVASEPRSGFFTDFLGGRTRISSLYDAVSGLDGQVGGPPIPQDFHAEAVEWIGLLKTAISATGRYIAMEWGAGWAPWLIAGGLAARSRGISDIKLYGVEADPAHFEGMTQHFEDNGFRPQDHVLLQAAVGASAGTARWPKEPDPRNAWGTRPVREDGGKQVDQNYLHGRVEEFLDVDILAGTDLLRREPLWDMVHIDIQGWEGEVCRSCIDLLSERVKWVIIGVHSRLLDAELLTLFHGSGWQLEHEKPTRFTYIAEHKSFEAMTTIDGTQVWKNCRLAK
jgi:FkbM family methyltransferase